MIPIAGKICMVTGIAFIAFRIGYEVGCYHRNTADFVEAAELRWDYWMGTHP